MAKLSDIEVEELLCSMAGLDCKTTHISKMDQYLRDEYQITFSSFKKLVETLIDHTEPIKSDLDPAISYQVFISTDDYWVCRQQVNGL